MNVYVLIAIMALCWGAGGSMQKHGMASEFPRLSLGTLARDWRRIIKVLFTNRVWLGGQLVMAAGGGAFVYATSVGDISVIQPLSNTSGVVAVLIGVMLLGERLSGIEVAAVLLLIGGAIVVGFSSEARTAGEAHPGMLLVLAVAAAAVLAAGFAAFGLRGQGGRTALIMAFSSGIAFGLTNLLVKVVTEASKGGGEGMRVNLEVIGGLLGSYPIYVLLAALLVGMVGYQLACSHGRIAVIQPVTTVFSNALPILGGWLVFDEAMNAGKLAGIGIILAGTVLLTLGRGESTA